MIDISFSQIHVFFPPKLLLLHFITEMTVGDCVPEHHSEVIDFVVNDFMDPSIPTAFQARARRRKITPKKVKFYKN